MIVQRLLEYASFDLLTHLVYIIEMIDRVIENTDIWLYWPTLWHSSYVFGLIWSLNLCNHVNKWEGFFLYLSSRATRESWGTSRASWALKIEKEKKIYWVFFYSSSFFRLIQIWLSLQKVFKQNKLLLTGGPAAPAAPSLPRAPWTFEKIEKWWLFGSHSLFIYWKCNLCYGEDRTYIKDL